MSMHQPGARHGIWHVPSMTQAVKELTLLASRSNRPRLGMEGFLLPPSLNLSLGSPDAIFPN